MGEEQRDLEQGVIQKFNRQTELEKTTQASLGQVPELRRGERSAFLGQFRERVVKVLSRDQVRDKVISPVFLRAMDDHRAKIVFLRGDLIEEGAKYMRQAAERKLRFKVVDSPEFSGPVGLVLASDDAVNEDDIYIG
ncbi:MAG: DUF1694 domain-containing protein [Bacillota bacterium]